MRIPALVIALGVCGGALAEESRAPTQRGELGVRYWLSTGETKRSHNAQPFDPAAGNPTSVLLYENLDAHVLEIFGRQNFGNRWFLKGFLGVGRVNTGSFDDEDYAAGQFKFLDTTSSVTRGRIGYGALDVGRDEWALRHGRTRLGAFIGYSQWTEDVDAYGITTTVDALGIGGDEPNSVLVITNKITWKSLRVGFAADVALGERARVSLDLALIPYSRFRNEDSHHLRGDLGAVPNILLEGEGRGVQLDAELRYRIRTRTELGVGVRYWYLDAYKGDRTTPNRPDVPRLPIVEVYSERIGATLSLRRTW